MFKSITNISTPKKWMYTPKEGEQFFFMHIPKTGGTTFRKMLTNHFPEGSYYPTQEDLIANGGGYLSQKKIQQNFNGILEKSLIMGHYNIDLVNYLKPDVKVIAFFRNPISRILSHVKHIIKHDVTLQRINDPNEVIFKKQNSIFNVQTKALGFPKKNSDINDIKKIIDNLYFVGVLEEFDTSIRILEQQSQFKLDKINKQNAIDINILNQINDQTMSFICRKIKFEIILYNYVLNKYETAKSKLS